MPTGDAPTRRPARLTTLAVLALIAAVPLLGVAVGELLDHRDVRQIPLQLAGSREAACRVIQPDAAGCPVPEAAVRRYRSAVRGDGWLVAGYVLAGLGVFGLCARFLYGSGARRVARWCLSGVLLAGAADAGENLALLAGLGALDRPAGDTAFAIAASLAVLKFAVVGPLLPVFVILGSVLGGRRVTPRSEVRREEPGAPDIAAASDLEPGTDRRPDIILPPAVADASTATVSASVGHAGPDVQQQLHADEGAEAAATAGPRPGRGRLVPDRAGPEPGRWRNAGRVPPGRPPAEVGICASGGGIRSASVTLGALQALRQDVLSRARYLVSVSGGGYMTGAFQLALTDAGKDADSLATPGDVFAPGSAEEDHLRRHGRYLADGGREWLAALGVVLRGVAASLALLTLGVVVIGVGLNTFYRAAPVVDITRLVPRFDTAAGTAAPGYPAPPVAVWRTLAAGAAIAVVAWVLVMVGLLADDRRFWVIGGLSRNLFRATVAISGVVAVYAIAVPAVVWAMARLSWTTGITSPVPAASFTAVVTTLLTWFGALASTMWRRTERLRASGDKVGGLSGLLGRGKGEEVVERQVATGWGQRLIVWAVHAVLAFVFVFVGAWTTAAAHRWPVWLGPVLLGVLVGAGFLIDQTWLSLHPFYRSRLASAFAVRRARMPDRGVGALAYAIEEPSTLSTYGRPVDGFPQVIFVAAAALSGQSRTPPGRRAAAFAMSWDYVGGPEVGWVRTSTLEKTCKPALRRDVTVQAAMAVSGAAFASAMGRHAAAVQRLLALSNVRLGTWLPNPGFLAELGRTYTGWRTPRLPGARRLPYQLREIVGAYPAEGRMLLCTDGGHWENLGLVELLRHRCRTVVCIDASGDAPPFATTLSEAITLAYEELGVRITLTDPTGVVPGGADPLEPSKVLERLNARLSRSAVLRGTIEYPEPFQVDGEATESSTGTLVVAKALLTPDVPYELLAYALKETAFPHQSTGDQFFDHEQFDAYPGPRLPHRHGRGRRGHRRPVQWRPSASRVTVPNGSGKWDGASQMASVSSRSRRRRRVWRATSGRASEPGPQSGRSTWAGWLATSPQSRTAAAPERTSRLWEPGVCPGVCRTESTGSRVRSPSSSSATPRSARGRTQRSNATLASSGRAANASQSLRWTR
jgi:hypothetical protein